MWKKLYSNSGLILLAILAAGIWFNNILSLFSAGNAPEYTSFDAAPVVFPTPAPRQRAAKELLYKKFPKLISIEEALRAPILKPKKPKPIIIEDATQTPAQITYEELQTSTARCKDGTYSFSRSRRGACSHHGGIAQWFSQ